MNAQIKKLTQAFPAFRLRLADNKRWALMAGVGLAVAATAIIVSVLWTGNRGYVSLYGRQENLPVSQIVTVLDGEKLTYRIDPQSGQILVPEDALSKTRMTLAAKGVQAILPSGYELMDKDEVLGSSQFVQNVRYKRSLEGELAQSIMSLDAVESAIEVVRPCATMRWSSTAISSKPSACCRWRVRAISAVEGSAQPLGWLCASSTLAAWWCRARRAISRG